MATAYQAPQSEQIINTLSVLYICLGIVAIPEFQDLNKSYTASLVRSDRV